ncbi:MAG: thioredoxin domain-containing protein [Gammaproteobacteria bacterium]|nr:thioredoxin domain-containing protein [Gammaproteobacteria bacterium]
MKKLSIIITALLVLLSVFAVASYVYKQEKADQAGENAQKNASVLVRDYSPTLGNKEAKVTIVEFFDPACGTCSAFYPLVKQLMSEHPGKINLVLRYLPLHPNSDVIVSIFEAARLQGKFWQTLERAYTTQQAWIEHHTARPEQFWLQLGVLGLDMERLNTDMQSPEVARRVQQDLQDAQQLNVRKTPGFFVNGKPLIEFGYQQLRQLVQSEIKATE